MDYQHYFLVDFENIVIGARFVAEVAALENTALLLVVGAKQNRLDTQLVKAMLDMKGRAQLVECKITGSNALDMYLVYQIGILRASNPEASFTIISHDKDYDPLIDCLRADGCRISRKPYTPVSETDPIVKEVITYIIDCAQRDSRSMPKSLQALSNWLQTRCGGLSERQFTALIRNLTARRVVELNGDKLIYCR